MNLTYLYIDNTKKKAKQDIRYKRIKTSPHQNSSHCFSSLEICIAFSWFIYMLFLQNKVNEISLLNDPPQKKTLLLNLLLLSSLITFLFLTKSSSLFFFLLIHKLFIYSWIVHSIDDAVRTLQNLVWIKLEV